MMQPIEEPVIFFLVIMTLILIMPLLSERVHLPGIVGVIIGGMLIGPNGFNILPANDRMEFLSTIGLIYLMFSAGLEVDFHQFMRVKGKSAVFGLLTFTIPQALGMALGWLIGLPLLGCILLGSAFALTYFTGISDIDQAGRDTQRGSSGNRWCNHPHGYWSFIILAIVLGADGGQLEVGYFIKLLSLLIVFTLAILFRSAKNR